MCLMVYLGTDAPLAGFDAVAPGQIGLDHGPGRKPQGLCGKSHVARVADRMADGWNCSCVFLDLVQGDGATPAELDRLVADHPETGTLHDAFATLRQIAAAALVLDPEACLLSCWSGEEDLPPALERRLPPEGLLANRFLFDDVSDGGTGGNPPVLIRLYADEGGTPCSERS
ncbi:hypothetical protein [Roseicyclus mahoneyensis]|uniref:Uncharacterized protein n=1 Tax=Roseicyclus mahoneyensis TaxID=164332 RepID=A0A316GJT6_9RHOB|nr:hypothetical protein [Roseicyclus mahoneyensis]PWK61051.1 hypothetical protein C7455_103251 [Roseicyclus mahoneyensis]